MRYCKTCNAYVAEPFGKCPLCQNEMIQKETMPEEFYIFPNSDGTRKRSVMFKMLLYMSVLALVISGCLDYVIGLHGSLHWSYFVAVGCAFVVVAVAPLFVKVRPLGEIVWHMGFWGSLVAILIMWYVDAWDVLMGLVLPILLMVLLVTEFIVVVAEKNAGSMIFYLLVVLGTAALVIIRWVRGLPIPLLLSIAVSAAVVLTVLLAALKAEWMIGDLKKRLST